LDTDPFSARRSADKSHGTQPSVERRTDGTVIVQGNEPAEVAVVADIWKNILRVDAVRREDNFFEMGGSSLQAMLLASRVLKATGVELSLSIFLDDPTFGALSKAVSADLAQSRAAASSGS
jgi:aryl carrier-like protein